MFIALLSMVFAKSLIEVPQGCISIASSTECQVMAKQATKIKTAEIDLYLQKMTAISFIEKPNLLKGHLIAKGKGYIKTAFADFDCQGCTVGLEIQNQEIWVSLYEGKLRILKYGEKDWQEMPKYSFVKIMSVSVENGKAKESVARVLSLDEYQKNYQNFPELLSLFKKTKEYYESNLRNQRFIASKAYQDAAKEKLLVQKQKQQAQKIKKEAWQKEREEMRRLYRKKHYLQ